MQKVSTPAFAKQLRAAVDQGQVVLIATPAQPSSQRLAPAPSLPRNRGEAALTAAFCLLFKLTRSESYLLVWLLMHDFGAKEELRIAASALVGREVTDSTVKTTVSTLRRKLKLHNIGIVTLSGIGYGLDGDARHEIRTVLAKYDTGYTPRRARSKPKSPAPTWRRVHKTPRPGTGVAGSKLETLSGVKPDSPSKIAEIIKPTGGGAP